MSNPKVTKRDRKLHISYETKDRILSAKVYPVPAPNGSSILIQGKNDGLRISWRGGRRRKEPLPSNRTDVIMVDDSDDGQAPKTESTQGQYEDLEDEMDPDCPYPKIIRSLKIDIGCAATGISVPSMSEVVLGQTPSLLKTHIIAVAACADGKIRAFNIPFAPPLEKELSERITTIREQSIEITAGLRTPVNDVTVKIRPIISEVPTYGSRSRNRDAEPDGEILIASISSMLNVWKLHITSKGFHSAQQPLLQCVPLTPPGVSCCFHPSQRSNQILISSCEGLVRLYDPLAPKSGSHRPSSRDSALSATTHPADLGKWIMTFRTPFYLPKDDISTNPSLAVAKKVLDAQWTLNGNGIMVLLEDGKWGIWDLIAASQDTGKNFEAFALQGFLTPSPPIGDSDSVVASQRRPNQRLAPMTPNTRQIKSQQLFTKPTKPAGLAPRGGICVSRTVSRTGQSEESIVMWHNHDIQSINNLQSFYQRSISGSGSGVGSLYAPGLTQLAGLDLLSEEIMSINYFVPSAKTPTSSQIPTQARDLLIATEHRIIIIQNLENQLGPRQLFQPNITTTATDRPTPRDQAMLDAGSLDLGGMDRMLDNMATVGDALGGVRPRRVGFAR